MYCLKKNLYPLKQVSIYCYKKFGYFMIKHNFSKTSVDQCVFIKRYINNYFIILLLYVNDILIVGHDKKITNMKKALSKSFTMKDLELANQILGINIIRDHSKRLLWLSQEKYFKKILKRFNMDTIKLVNVSLVGHMKLSKNHFPTSEEDKCDAPTIILK